MSRILARRLLVVAALGAAVLWGAWLRVDRALGDPGFDPNEPAGMLRSDPALLYHLTEELRDALAAGHLPSDFRADPDLQHPGLTDVPAEFTVGQEFLVAAAARVDPETPLVVTAVRVMAFLAALFPLGLFLFVRAATRNDLVALFAVFLALVLPANYRTLGFVLVREDLSLPLWLLHLGLLAHSLQSDRARDHALSGLALAAALATWHALGFVVALELSGLWIAALATGRGPTAAGAWQLVAPLLAALFVPALRTAGALMSPAAVLAVGLYAPLLWPRGPRAGSPRTVRWAVGLGSALWFGLTRPFAPPAYDHVRDVLLAKLRFLGRLPEDPNAMSFDARLLWQGPFSTLDAADLVAWLGRPATLLALMSAGFLGFLLRARARTVAREGARTGARLEALALGLLALALPAAWAFERLTILLGALVPLVIALALGRLWSAAPSRRRTLALGAVGVLSLGQLSTFAGFVSEHRVSWYLPPDARHELTRALAAVQRLVPEGEAVVCDFMNSTAVLAFAGRPIVLQPKYETEHSRRQAQAFLETLFHGTAKDFKVLVTERFQCQYVLLDRYVLWDLSRYAAGLSLAQKEPLPGSAAQVLLDRVPARNVPGFELLYASDPPTPAADLRLYRVR